MKKNVFLVFSKDDETITELKDLIQNVENIEHLKITQKNDFQLDDTTKQNILDCDIFICCLSKKFFESKLIDTVKFAYCIARKQINTFHLDKEELEEMMRNNIQKMEEQILLLKKKDRLEDKDKRLLKECFLLEANHNFFRLKTIEYSIDQIKKVNIFFINSSDF